MTRIAIIYATAGGGHLSLAKACEEALHQYAPGQFEVVFFNPFPETFSYTHKTLANYFVDVYRLGLKATENPTAISAIKGFNQLTITRKISKFLRDTRPDIVIANHPLVAAALPTAIKKSYITPKVVIHFCDPFTTHKTWFINKTADLYLSPTIEMTKLAKKYGIPESRIQTIGWMTKHKFVKGPKDKQLARDSLGLDPHKFTIFIGGAGVGSSKTLEICHLLTESSILRAHAQVIINTGLNTSLVTEVMRLVQKHPQFLMLIPYSANVSELLSASDIVVGKAGPNFIFESIHCLRPLIITDHLPGHEEGNPKYVKNAGLGWVERDPEKVISRLESCLKNPSTLNDKLKNLQKIKLLHLASSSRFVESINQLS